MTPAAEPLMKSLVMLHSDRQVHPQDGMLMYMDKIVLSVINLGTGYASYVNKHADNSNPTTQPSAKAGTQPYSKAGSYSLVHNTAARVFSRASCAALVQRGHNSSGYHGWNESEPQGYNGLA